MKVNQPGSFNSILDINEKKPTASAGKGNVKPVAGEKYIPGLPVGSVKVDVPLNDRKVKVNPIKKLFLKIIDFVTGRSRSGKADSAPAQTARNHLMFKKGSDRQELTRGLLLEWTGKDFNKFDRGQIKSLDTLNSSAMTALSNLLKDEKQLSMTQLQNCLVCSEGAAGFPNKVQELLSNILKKHSDLNVHFKNSDGLFKTPVLISLKPQEPLMVPQEIVVVGKQKGSSHVSYYPRIETSKGADSSVTTLYLSENFNANSKATIDNLAQALKDARKRAEDGLPAKSKEIVSLLFKSQGES
ncbi:hypothetical protein [Endozoicomonas ascidiicola]|uniref:hypothetical protein n=1 Tax=Endozoicomonas ascidiicola TaxID=1698521 RepID=UPI00083223C4|nr:hypothetical protein [Endozoicomonas ascidiicola]